MNMRRTPFAKRQIERMFWHDRIKFLNKAEDLREEGIDLIEDLDETLAERKFEEMREERNRSIPDKD
jgi:hypothetical protein